MRVVVRQGFYCIKNLFGAHSLSKDEYTFCFRNVFRFVLFTSFSSKIKEIALEMMSLEHCIYSLLQICRMRRLWEETAHHLRASLGNNLAEWVCIMFSKLGTTIKTSRRPN